MEFADRSPGRANPAEIRNLVDRALEAFGRVDVLVTNSGGPPPGTFESTSPEAWHAAVDVLLTSAVELSSAVLPGMKQRRFGRILNVTSITVKQPIDNLILSNALRAAVTGMARTLASEVASFGITVNNVLPGYTRTERLTELATATASRTGSAPADFYERLEREIPGRRLGDPRELAADRRFENLAQLWVIGDPYKHRATRSSAPGWKTTSWTS